MAELWIEKQVERLDEVALKGSVDENNSFRKQINVEQELKKVQR